MLIRLFLVGVFQLFILSSFSQTSIKFTKPQKAFLYTQLNLHGGGFFDGMDRGGATNHAMGMLLGDGIGHWAEAIRPGGQGNGQYKVITDKLRLAPPQKKQA